MPLRFDIGLQKLKRGAEPRPAAEALKAKAKSVANGNSAPVARLRKATKS